MGPAEPAPRPPSPTFEEADDAEFLEDSSEGSTNEDRLSATPSQAAEVKSTNLTKLKEDQNIMLYHSLPISL